MLAAATQPHARTCLHPACTHTLIISQRVHTCSTKIAQPASPSSIRSRRRHASCVASVLEKNTDSARQLSTTQQEQEQHHHLPHSQQQQQQPDNDTHCTLFDLTHVSSWSPSLLAWLPLGTVVASARVVLWVLCIALDLPVFRNKAVVDAYLALLGVKVTWRNLERLPQDFHVMVSNHTECGDLMALFTLRERYTHLISPAIPSKAMNTQHLPVKLRPAVLETYDALAEAAKDPTTPPVHLFPEGGLTNGSGMLQFSRGFTKFTPPGTPVVPVALHTHTPWGLRTHTLTSSFAQNLFVYSLCPQVHIEAEVLPPMVQGEGENRGAFVKRVQDAIAQYLSIPVSDMTIQQKRQKMRDFERKQEQGSKSNVRAS